MSDQWGDVREKAKEAAAWPGLNGSSDEAQSGPGRKITAEELVAFMDTLIEEGSVELFHDSSGEVFATLRSTVGGARSVRTFPIGSKKHGDFKRRFQGLFAEQERARGGRRRVIPGQVWSDAQQNFEGAALHDGPCCEIYLRVAPLGDRTVIDLGDDTGAAVEVTAQGWAVIEEPGVRFYRSRAMRALPQPVRDGSLGLLRKYVHVVDEGLPLVLAFLVSSIGGISPFAILVLYGEQGSSKSTTSYFCRQLVDPAAGKNRSLPKDERDLAIATHNSYVLTFDNLSTLPGWASDALCRVSGGGGFTTRTHYSDRDEEVFEGARPVILNGISEAPRLPDLLDRSYLVECPAIGDDQRREERELLAAFATDRPAIFGYLLDGVASGLARRDVVSFDRPPRMADAARFAAAAEEGLDLVPGAMAAAFELTRDSANAVAIEASPFAQEILALHDAHGYWEGTTTQLLGELNGRRGEGKPPARWPAGASAASAELKRVIPVLRVRGVPVELPRRVGRGGVRVLRIGRERPQATSG